MDFNPFHVFRKNQRVLLAVMAIVCMFLFVLSSGLGRGADPIDWLMGIFGRGRGGYPRGKLVTTLYGKEVYEGDLSQVQARRDLATNFLIAAANRGAQQKIFEMAQAFQKEGQAPGDQLGRVVADWAGLLASQQRQALFLIPTFAKRDLPVLRKIATEAADNPNQQDKARDATELARAIQVQGWLYSRRDSKEFYFGGGPKTADLLDFLLWKQVADKLGIALTEDQVVRAVNYEAAGQQVVGSWHADDKLVRDFFQEYNNRRRNPIDTDELMKALTAELRVGMAQEAILNQKGGVRAPLQAMPGFGSSASDPFHEVPAAMTPREFLDAFRQARTTLRVAMLPVDVKDYVAKVEGTPPESTLRQLYSEYKATEPTPDSDKPGFKEPRRVRVEYLTAKPNDPYYTDLAKATLLLEGGVARLLPTPGFGAGGVLPALASAAAVVVDPVRQKYDLNYEPDERRLLEVRNGVGVSPTAVKAAASTAAVGSAVGADGRVAALAALSAAAQAEAVTAAKVDAGILAAGTLPTPFAGMALPFIYTYAPEPYEAVRTRLQEKEEAKIAPRLLARDLDKVAEELGKLRSKPKEAEAYVAKAAKEYHLEAHAMAEAKSKYGLVSDPALKPLADAVASPSGRPFDAASTEMFLSGSGVYGAQKYPPAGSVDSTKDLYLYWRSEDKSARERTFEEARPLVLDAWKLEQARPLAWEAASKIKAAVKEASERNHSAAEVEKVLHGHGKPFILDKVSNLLPVAQPQPGFGSSFTEYKVPADRVPYPQDDFVNRLLTLQKPGDATVLRDKPASTFYVAALLDRDDPTRRTENGREVVDLKEFENLYQQASLSSSARANSLWAKDVEARRREYRKDVLRDLRAEATGGKVDAQGNILLPEGLARNDNQADPGE